MGAEPKTVHEYGESNHWCDFFEREVRQESPRAMAILSAAVLDEAMTSLLKLALLPCPTSTDPLFDDSYAPIGSFSAKIEVAERMGIISPGVAQSLHLIRRIRNDFAHDIAGCSFENAVVCNRVGELRRLNDIAKPERRTQFPEGVVGDFQSSVSWLIFWIWHLVESLPRRCSECGQLHRPKNEVAGTGEDDKQ